MTADGFRFHSYEWRGRTEWMLVRGPRHGPHVLILPPLFEEMNFTRAVLAGLGRALAARGIGSSLPDLPGTGESPWALEEIGWAEWREAARTIGEAVTARTGRPLLTCAFRGGTLLDDAVPARARWRYAPVAGEALLRQLRRAQRIADAESGAAADVDGEVVHLAGYPLNAAMRAGLAAAIPLPVADREAPVVDVMAPWRRAEPAGDEALCQSLADDICAWVETCAGF